MIDLDAYLARIGVDRAPSPTLPALARLQTAHSSRIPFENVDVRLRRPVGLDLASLQAKLVRGCRGGYCFEQNTLFAAVLSRLGFEVTTLEARVRPPGATATLPRTHMVLRVDLDGRGWVVDVGFGGDGPLAPVALDGESGEQHDGVYRVEREGEAVHVLRRRWHGSWRDLYAFTLAPALPVDFEVAHHYTSSHPNSVFVRTLTVQRSEPAARHILRGRSYTLRQGEQEQLREIEDDELPALLRERFNLDIPDEDVRRALGP